jgi:hypothetical protein
MKNRPPVKKFAEEEPEEEEPEEMEVDLEGEDDEDEEDEDFMDMEGVLSSFFTTDDGDNVATALVTIGNNMEGLQKALETQNKILLKILSVMNSKKVESA